MQGKMVSNKPTNRITYGFAHETRYTIRAQLFNKNKSMKNIHIKEGEAVCHDCKNILNEGDKCVPYQTSSGDFYKCVDCYKEDSSLRDFQETEVYSRIVGYIRPVKQWNVGKTAEYADRKEFVVEGGGSRC